MMPPFMNMANMQGGMQGQMWDAFRAGAMWAQSQAGQMQGGMPPIPPSGYGQAPPNPPPQASDV